MHYAGLAAPRPPRPSGAPSEAIPCHIRYIVYIFHISLRYIFIIICNANMYTIYHMPYTNILYAIYCHIPYTIMNYVGVSTLIMSLASTNMPNKQQIGCTCCLSPTGCKSYTQIRTFCNKAPNTEFRWSNQSRPPVY